jgi:hypothetical protein
MNMNFIYSFEFITLITSIVVIMLFKLHKKLINFTLSSTKIFLPPNTQDFELIKNIKKDKNSQASGIMRTCSVMEFIENVKDDNVMDIDLITFFYLTCSLNIIAVEVYKLFIGPAAYSEKLEKGSADETVTSSFAFITIIYINFVFYKQTFNKGFTTYSAKVFYAFFLLFLVLTGLLYYFSFDKYIIDINYNSICEFLNNRYEKVLSEAGSSRDHILCNEISMKVFYSIIFSMTMAFLFRPCCRIGYLDNIMISEDSLGAEQSSVKWLSLLCKFKVIITAFLPFAFINSLFKDQILQSFPIISDYSYKIVIIPSLLFIEFLVNAFLLNYYSNIFNLRNYYEMLEFCKNPDEKILPYLKYKISTNNSFFWELFSNIFNLSFLPVLIYLYFVNRSNLLFEYKAEINTLLESFSYLFLTTLVLAKSVFSTGYMVYLQNSTNKKSLI